MTNSNIGAQHKASIATDKDKASAENKTACHRLIVKNSTDKMVDLVHQLHSNSIKTICKIQHWHNSK